MPGTVFAIALAALFSVQSPLRWRVVLVGTLWILPLAYLIRNLPIAGRAVLAGFRGLDPALEEAAAALGACALADLSAGHPAAAGARRWPRAPPSPL